MSTESADTPAKPTLKQRLDTLMEEYGSIAIYTYLTLFVVSIVSFSVAIKMGYQPEGAAGTTGIFAIAYIATKGIQPLRILATIALTPLIARAVRRR